MNAACSSGRMRRLIQRVIAISAGAALLMVLVASLFDRVDYAPSLIAGSAIALASFLALVFTVTRSIGERKRSSGAMALLAGAGILKLLLLGAILWWLIGEGMIDPMVFLLGFSSVVIALIVEALILSRKACDHDRGDM